MLSELLFINTTTWLQLDQGELKFEHGHEFIGGRGGFNWTRGN